MRRVLAAVAAVGLLTACGSSKPGAGSAATVVKGSSAATVTVKNFSFTPGDLTVAKGTKVTWKFEDSAKHNGSAKGDAFRSKDIESGAYSYVFNTVGKYSYLCSLHQYMTGSIVVK